MKVKWDNLCKLFEMVWHAVSVFAILPDFMTSIKIPNREQMMDENHKMFLFAWRIYSILF